MKLKRAAVAFVVALVLVSSFVSTVIADSEENSGPDDTIFENSGDTQDGGDSGESPLGGGGGDDVGGGTPG